jgi:hypothetical protein
MYTLLNTIKLGMESQLMDDETITKLEQVHTLDYMSGLVFRLFEDLDVEHDGDPMRFRLEIMVHKGTQVKPAMV